MNNLISLDNIDQTLGQYVTEVETVGPIDPTLDGVNLLSFLKREKIGSGPYPEVTLFEAANRIMSDLVILHGVRWLLKNEVFPFSEYLVEFGHDNENGFDIRGNSENHSLIGEAFNVATSFYQGKKTSMLKKLRKEVAADFRLIMVNSDAISANYRPKPRSNEYFVFVNIKDGTATIAPHKAECH